MLGRDPSTPPIVGRGGIPSVEEKGTNMQGGDKVFGVFLEGRHKVARPILKKKKKKVILRLPMPKTQRQVREFLGATGFCSIWIPRYSEIAQPFLSS